MNKQYRKYLAHYGGCPAGRPDICECSHPANNHFRWKKQPCAHCSCEKFAPGQCVCGLDDFVATLIARDTLMTEAEISLTDLLHMTEGWPGTKTWQERNKEAARSLLSRIGSHYWSEQ